jgi:hypothetical protein
LYEAEGHGTDVTLESRFGLTGARLVNLLEEGPAEARPCPWSPGNWQQSASLFRARQS